MESQEQKAKAIEIINREEKGKDLTSSFFFCTLSFRHCLYSSTPPFPSLPFLPHSLEAAAA
jgi:hypothetical protein